MKYYLDSCIWMDYWENRTDKLRPLGEFAFSLIKKIVEEESQVIISDILLKELKKYYSEHTLTLVFELISTGTMIIKITHKDNQFNEAEIISRNKNLPLHDVLHAIIARDNNAIFITRDKHFLEISDLVDVKKPEELL